MSGRLVSASRDLSNVALIVLPSLLCSRRLFMPVELCPPITLIDGNDNATLAFLLPVPTGKIMVACCSASITLLPRDHGTFPSVLRSSALPGLWSLLFLESALTNPPVSSAACQQDSGRLVTEASIRSPVPVDSSVCIRWCGWRLMRSLGHPVEKKDPSSIAPECSRTRSSIDSSTWSVREHDILERSMSSLRSGTHVF